MVGRRKRFRLWANKNLLLLALVLLLYSLWPFQYQCIEAKWFWLLHRTMNENSVIIIISCCCCSCRLLPCVFCNGRNPNGKFSCMNLICLVLDEDRIFKVVVRSERYRDGKTFFFDVVSVAVVANYLDKSKCHNAVEWKRTLHRTGRKAVVKAHKMNICANR